MPSFFDRPFTPAPVGFTGARIDRADDMRRNAEAIFAARMHPGARWLLLDGLKPHCTPEGRLFWSRRSELPDDAGEAIFLGMEDGAPRFACAGACEDGEVRAYDARGAAAHLPADEAAIVAQARSLIDWHERHRFCGRCGAPTEAQKAGYARQCAGCGLEHFPRNDPVVIMLAVTPDKALLGRQPMFPANFYSALAGFVEPGESLEEAVRRETFEEVGIRTNRVAYVASQPWPFPYSLMMGAFAEAETTDIRLQEDEIEDAGWYTRAEVEAALAGRGDFMTPPPFAIAHTLLRTWVDHK